MHFTIHVYHHFVCDPCAPKVRSFRWGIGPVTPKKEDPVPLEVTITKLQQVQLHAHPMADATHEAPVDGPISFTIQAGNCTIIPLDDMDAMIISGDTPGDSTVLVSADADLGAGIETIMDTVLVHVTDAKATSLGLSLGTPEPKP